MCIKLGGYRCRFFLLKKNQHRITMRMTVMGGSLDEVLLRGAEVIQNKKNQRK